MNLTPEQREQIAKFAGYTIYYNRCGDDDFSELYYAVNENSKIGWPGDYTPDTNDAQAFELLRKLFEKMVEGDDPGYKNEWMLKIWRNKIRGLTLNLAICHAVLALLDNTENDNG